MSGPKKSDPTRGAAPYLSEPLAPPWATDGAAPDAPAPPAEPEVQAQRAPAPTDKHSKIQDLKHEAETALQAGDFSTARRIYRSLLLVKLGEGSPISKAEVYYGLAVVCERTGETRKALQFLQRATDTEPNFPAAQELRSKLQT